MSESNRAPHRLGAAVPDRILSDRRLASRVSGGDPSALEELFRRYQQPIYRFCAAMVGPEEAKDVLQNVMTKAMTSMPDDDEFRLKPWLYMVARNECIDHHRAVSRTRPGFEGDALEETSGRHDPHRTALEKERLRLLVSDLNDLPERQRAGLVMRELSGLGYPEIATSLHTTESGAKQLVYEARLSLEQAELGRRLDCAEIREAISAQDGRRLRGKKVKAHLRACSDCTDFRRSINERRAGFRSLFPALPAGAAAGLFDVVREGASSVSVSGSGAAATAAGGLAAGGSGIVVKGLVAAAIVGGAGVGASEVVNRHADPVRPVPESAGVDAGDEATGAPGADTPERRSSVATDTRSTKVTLESRGTNAESTREAVAAAPGDAGVTEGSTSVVATPERVVPGSGAGGGPPSLPDAAAAGQARAEAASGAKPGLTGNAPPSSKPASTPGPPASPGKSGEAPGQAEVPSTGDKTSTPGKSGK